MQSHEKFMLISTNKPSFVTPPFKDNKIQVNKYTPNIEDTSNSPLEF